MHRASLVKLRRIAIERTKLRANSIWHKPMSYGQMLGSERYLKAEIAGLRGQIADMLAQAEQVGAA